MFPDFDFEAVTEDITAELGQSNILKLGRVFMFDWEKKRMIIENGRPKEAETDKEKVQQFLQYLLRTKIDKYNTLKDTEFGMTYFNFIGNTDLPMGFINSEIHREIEENVKTLNLVDSIEDFEASREGTYLNVIFTVIFKDNTIATFDTKIAMEG